MTTKLTNAEFAMQCASIAKNAAAWAADVLTLPEFCHEPASPHIVARFTDDMRYRLARIEHMAGPAPLPQEPEE